MPNRSGPSVNRSIRPQRNHSREHRLAEPGLEPRRQRRNPLLQHHLRRLRQSRRLHLRSLLRFDLHYPISDTSGLSDSNPDSSSDDERGLKHEHSY
jgi:hypothetical protein